MAFVAVQGVAASSASASVAGWFRVPSDGELPPSMWPKNWSGWRGPKVAPDTYVWVNEEGKYTFREISAEGFERMAEKLAYGIESGGTGIGSGFSAEAAAGEDIWAQIYAETGSTGFKAALERLNGEGMMMMERLGSYGPIRALGTVGLAATAFEVGYQIGGLIADVLGLEGGEPEPIQIHAESLEAVSPGDSLGGAAKVGVYAPTSGWKVKLANEKGADADPSWPEPGTTNCSGKGTVEPPGGMPAGYEFLPGGTIKCGTEESVTQTYGIFFVPLTVSCLPGGSCSTPEKTTEGKAGTPLGKGSALPLAEECLEGKLGCERLPGWWWNHDPESRAETWEPEGLYPGQPKWEIEAEDPHSPLAYVVPYPERGESYVEYDERLEELSLVPDASALPEYGVNPDYGPEEVVETSPGPGTNVKPETEVKVRYNPKEAPESGGSSWAPPAIPNIDLTPLTETGLGCSTFPFGVFCWFKEAVEAFAVSPNCPLDVEIPMHAVTGTTDLPVDGCGAGETIMGPLRIVILVAATIGLGLLFAKQAMGTGGGDA